MGIYLNSSIGKKQVLGCAGALLVGFLLMHLLGNLKLLAFDYEKSHASYNAYCAFLMSLKPLIYGVEGLLALIFLVHVLTAVRLKMSNHRARGKVFNVRVTHASKSSPASFLTFFTGAGLALFIVFHLVFFKFGTYYVCQLPTGEIIRDMWLTVADTFANPLLAALYVLALFLMSAHLMHGIPSLFRTFGLAHAKWNGIFAALSALFQLMLTVGFLLTVLGTHYLAIQPEGKAFRRNLHAQQTEILPEEVTP